MSAFAWGFALGAWSWWAVYCAAKWHAGRKAPKPSPRPAADPGYVDVKITLPVDWKDTLTREAGCDRWIRIGGAWYVAGDDVADTLSTVARELDDDRRDAAYCLTTMAEVFQRTVLRFDMERMEREP